MAANPWDKFFWADWQNDPGLKLCSFHAQGVWMRMLCICAEANPKGYLVVNGSPLTNEDMAALFGKPVAEIDSAVAELETRGVFSRDRVGKIYCRKMVRDEKKRRTARENGKMGGNPTLSKNKENLSSDNPNGSNQKPEARSQKLDKNSDNQRLSGDKPPQIVGGNEFEDAKKAVFDLGVGLLKDAGTPDREARSIIGMWRKTLSDDDLLPIIVQARPKSEPVSYIQAAVKNLKMEKRFGKGYRPMPAGGG